MVPCDIVVSGPSGLLFACVCGRVRVCLSWHKPLHNGLSLGFGFTGVGFTALGVLDPRVVVMLFILLLESPNENTKPYPLSHFVSRTSIALQVHDGPCRYPSTIRLRVGSNSVIIGAPWRTTVYTWQL